ncbi:unnamed protein product, partial [Protopolystoma xenopodis]
VRRADGDGDGDGERPAIRYACRAAAGGPVEPRPGVIQLPSGGNAAESTRCLGSRSAVPAEAWKPAWRSPGSGRPGPRGHACRADMTSGEDWREREFFAARLQPTLPFRALTTAPTRTALRNNSVAVERRVCQWLGVKPQTAQLTSSKHVVKPEEFPVPEGCVMIYEPDL